jgi:hypothetical protein
MDFFLDNIFIIILLLVGAISQWLKSRGEARQEHDHPGYDPADIEEMIEEAERRQSRPAVPPPLPSRGNMAAPAPPLRRKTRDAAPAFTASIDNSSELARQHDIAEKIKELKRTRGARQFNESLIPRKRKAGTATPAGSDSLKARLGNRRQLRQAFVLKEILEKPIGLR